LVSSQTTFETVEVVKQLVDQMKVQVQPDTTELRLTLRPESLGEVTMRIITQNGIVSAMLFAESQRIKEAIEASLNELKNALTEKGVQVAEMSAFVADENSEREAQWSQRNGRTVSGARINRIMQQNGLGETGGIDGEEQEEDEAARNPLAVNYRA